MAAGMDHCVLVNRINDGQLMQDMPLDKRGWGKLASSLGTGEVGQLGLGTCGVTLSPVVMPHVFPHAVKAIAAGYLHTVVITEEGIGFACGLGKNGRLGTGAEHW